MGHNNVNDLPFVYWGFPQLAADLHPAQGVVVNQKSDNQKLTVSSQGKDYEAHYSDRVGLCGSGYLFG